MKVEEKVPMAANAINFIATHDDAPVEVIENALKAVEGHLKDARNKMRARRGVKPWWKVWGK